MLSEASAHLHPTSCVHLLLRLLLQSGQGGFSRFEGSNAISSDDYFGGDSHSRRPGGSGGGGAAYSVHAPDLQDIKDGVRQGVTKVATKLSTLASGVMSSIQVSVLVRQSSARVSLCCAMRSKCVARRCMLLPLAIFYSAVVNRLSCMFFF